MNHKISDIEHVTCELCQQKFQKLDNRHLKRTHKTTFDDYRKTFPDSPTKTLTQYKKDLEDNRKRQEAKRNKPQFVSKPCWNFEVCENTVENVNINIPKSSVTCQDCRDKNLFHPDYTKKQQHMSNLANKINKDQDIIDKRSESLRSRTPEQIASFVRKREKTLEKKLGPNWKEELSKLSKEAILDKLGPDAYILISDKRIETMLEKYDEVNAMLVDSFKEACRTSRIENNDQEEITRKTIETNRRRYGGDGPMASQEVRDKASKTRLKTFLPRLYKTLEKMSLTLLDEYTDAFTYNRYQCNACKSIFNSDWNQIQQGRKCQVCNNAFKPSRAENEIEEYLRSIGIENILKNNRTMISPYELDLVLPDYKVAIEHCGLFTHRDDVLRSTRKPRKKMNDMKFYHAYKCGQCQKIDYKLFTIFEDEWLFKENIVKAMLKQRLGKNTSQQVYARNCEIFEITFDIKRDFLEQFHIQGNDNSKVMLGAFSKDKDELVAIMTFSKPSIAKGSGKKKDGHWELNRFCTDYNYRVPGIAGKLLEHFKRSIDPNWKYIYSFADRRWSNGNLYHKLGFELETNVEKIRPNYWYVDCNKLKRLHRFSLRKTKGDDTSMTEIMLRLGQGYHIIYDCGNLKFSIKK